MGSEKGKIYIETTVLSYYVARPSRDLIVAGHQQLTQELWSKLTTDYQPYVSVIVLREAGRGDPQQAQRRLKAVEGFAILELDEAAEGLAQKLQEEKAIPEKYPEDALHVAIAAINGIDVLVTWNFSHLNNPYTRMMIRQVVENEGYECPEVVSPEEFAGGE